MFSKSCDHQWGPIKDGYQYCTTCNKAEAVAPPPPASPASPPFPPPCAHHWEESYNFNNSYMGRTTAINFILTCTKCGDMRLKTF